MIRVLEVHLAFDEGRHQFIDRQGFIDEGYTGMFGEKVQ